MNIFILRGNSCAVTKVLYLEILNSLMETSDSLALLSLDTKSSSHLAALTTQSFNVCSNFKPPVDGEAILHENVLLENMKLLRLAPSHPSLFPISARSLDFTQVIVGILKFSQSVLVKVHVLKCIDSCTDEITQVLTGLVLQGADPDVLVEVRYNAQICHRHSIFLFNNRFIIVSSGRAWLQKCITLTKFVI